MEKSKLEKDIEEIENYLADLKKIGHNDRVAVAVLEELRKKDGGKNV